MKPCIHRQVIGRLLEAGETCTSISCKLRIPLRTIQRIARQWKVNGNVDVKKPPGRPFSVNTCRIRSIIKKRISRNDGVSMNSIAKSLNISRWSVQNITKNSLGLRSYRFYKGQYLSDSAKQKRLKSCKKMLELLKMRRASDILWSDEKIFTIEKAHNSQNYRQLINPSLENSRKIRISTKTLFPKEVMVWAGISATGKTPLVFIEKNVKINAQAYQDEILKNAVMQWKQKNPNMIFQQDWAPAHGAKTTLAYLEQNFPGFLDKNHWPPNSPDLNPLDFSVWRVMEDKLKNKKIPNLNCLRQELIKIWNDIDINYLRLTVDSVTVRLQACIKANGGHFEQFL